MRQRSRVRIVSGAPLLWLSIKRAARSVVPEASKGPAYFACHGSAYGPR